MDDYKAIVIAREQELLTAKANLDIAIRQYSEHLASEHAKELMQERYMNA